MSGFKLLTLFFCLAYITDRPLQAQNVYRLSNRFDNNRFRVLFKQNSDGTFDKRTKSILSSLKGFISKQSEDRDTLFIKFWDITSNGGKMPGDPRLINSADNGATFAYVIDWGNKGYFDIPFTASTVTATSIPFRYRLKANSDLEAEFLNVGFNYFRVRGRTRFFKQEQIDPRQNYWGWGPFIAFSQQKLDSANTGGHVTIEKQVARLSYGISLIRSINNFSFLVALGFDNIVGSNAKYWEGANFNGGVKPWIGFGFGFKLIDFSPKTTNAAQ